ncbi:TPA: TIGR03759 family integrating conjugative element protein [Escherichia coli]|uniref:TIGR03759 family integrating conjugative element protein n=1 Tax=Proteus faecis TaxID=2050967 RepID=A0AAW7CWT8_9GAMM|nr:MULTISPECIES: TIGR03759 family integrating conjugative element protein [Enterobacterales]EFN6653860.1 TIGR03759 family integrating conjugative element protein [Escherichia coli O166:H6]EFN6739566.1 TIGR03759 family integrating conjugative element protein [Escherichia coli H6]EFN6866299.1 TIGR03759 family integrating conjugative element protein [Escherichia coli O4:H5]HBR0008043.1 TIGR03759 family integrating conjugative element protein [Klebsiella aerogenes]HCT7998677.1 TIGR03759 family int
MKNIRCVVLLGGCLMSAPLTAAQSVSGATRPVQIEAGKSAESQTQSLQYEAQEWGLSAEEYARFEALMKGRRGIQSPGLDPLTTLGIEARSDEERRRLAEKWVQQEFARAEKELAFQREVDAAWKRLYGQILPVSLGTAGATAGMVQGTAQRRQALFVQAENCRACDARLATLLAGKQPFDIYVLGTQGDDNRLRAWARQKNIPAERVRKREITLNHDGGLSLQYGLTTTPVVMQQLPDGRWRPLTP